MSEQPQLHNLSHPRLGPLINTEITDGIHPDYRDTKDPCPLYDGTIWHIYGSGGSSKTENWEILHATAYAPEGPWVLQEPAITEGISGGGIAAPAVEYDPTERVFHMFVQTHYAELNSKIEHLVSRDGTHFIYQDTVLGSIPNSPEAGIYDPHTTVINGQKYLTYSAFPTVSQPDLYLAKSITNTWYGPWERKGRILSHHEVVYHNQLGQPEYEWGLEGSQLIELPDGIILLNAVCFLSQGIRGTRQRVFFSVAHQPEGPYTTLGVVLNPANNEWECGENGHAAGVIQDDKLLLYYQARAGEGKTWRYGLVKYDIHRLAQIGRDALRKYEALNAMPVQNVEPNEMEKVAA